MSEADRQYLLYRGNIFWESLGVTFAPPSKRMSVTARAVYNGLGASNAAGGLAIETSTTFMGKNYLRSRLSDKRWCP